MKRSMLLIISMFFTATLGFANVSDNKGVAEKEAHSMHNHQHMRDHAGNMPPGLQKKDMPSGLSKQEKVPSGWVKGKKEGWENNNLEHGIK